MSIIWTHWILSLRPYLGINWRSSVDHCACDARYWCTHAVISVECHPFLFPENRIVWKTSSVCLQNPPCTSWCLHNIWSGEEAWLLRHSWNIPHAMLCALWFLRDYWNQKLVFKDFPNLSDRNSHFFIALFVELLRLPTTFCLRSQ